MKKVLRNIFIGIIILLILGAIGISIFTGKAVLMATPMSLAGKRRVKILWNIKKIMMIW